MFSYVGQIEFKVFYTRQRMYRKAMNNLLKYMTRNDLLHLQCERNQIKGSEIQM